jgi:hypothetical protein
MNKKSIKKTNYSDKDGFISLKKWMIKCKIEKHWINIFNYRIAMSIFKYDKSKNKRQNWRL